MKFEKFYDSLTTEQRKHFNRYEKARQDERTVFTWVTCALGSAAVTMLMMYLFVLNSAGLIGKK
jgi:hypothetical protein